MKRQRGVVERNREFCGTNAVVTGASSGIGRATALELSRRGVDRIVIHYRRNLEGAKQTARECGELGAQPVLLAADLGDFTAIEAFANQCWDELGVIHSWVNNAGVDVLTGEFAALDFGEKLNQLLQVDVIGTIHLSRLVVSRMSEQTLELPASMAFIGWDQSSAGMEGDAGQMFGPVKAAITAFAQSLAQTVAPKIRVNVVAPGWIQTSWGHTTSEYWDARARNESLMNRWGAPADIARAIAFVSAPENTFVTSQVIEVNGGWNRRYDR